MILFAEGALEDLERIFAFNLESGVEAAREQLELVRSAVMVLERHPEIGRRVGRRSSLRELIISRGKTGYVALYEHSPREALIRVVAIRHQREAGYRDR